MRTPRRSAAGRPPHGGPGARTGRPGRRPSRCRASAGPRRSARRSPGWTARGRCPRCAGRTRRSDPAPGASCTVPSALHRCEAPPSEKERSARAWTQHATEDERPASMLIGAHVSPAGGPANAIARGEERACRAIQFFNQSPRAWRPRVYSAEEVAAYHEAVDGSEVDALLIHAVYLLNCASEDAEIRDKSL